MELKLNRITMNVKDAVCFKLYSTKCLHIVVGLWKTAWKLFIITSHITLFHWALIFLLKTPFYQIQWHIGIIPRLRQKQKCDEGCAMRRLLYTHNPYYINNTFSFNIDINFLFVEKYTWQFKLNNPYMKISTFIIFCE